MNKTLLTASSAVLAALVFLASCTAFNDKPTGTVVATVDGFSVTEEMLVELERIIKAQSRQDSPELKREELIDRIISIHLASRDYDKLRLDDFETWWQVSSAKTNALFKHKMEADIDEIDGEVAQLYEQRYKSSETGGDGDGEGGMEYHTRHILVDSEELARDLISQIEGGADFAELARQNSKDSGSGSKGGDLGWYKPTSLVPPYAESMQSLKVGEMTKEPVKSQFGWHIIELLEEPRQVASAGASAGGGEMEYHTRHILVEGEEQARGLISQIEGGADFAELARENSKDSGSGSRGGDLGWYKPTSLVKPYADSMQSLKVGEMTKEPVKSRFGWHIIELIEEPRKAAGPSLAEMSPQLRNEIIQNRFISYLEELKEQARIDIKSDPDPVPATTPAAAPATVPAPPPPSGSDAESAPDAAPPSGADTDPDPAEAAPDAAPDSDSGSK